MSLRSRSKSFEKPNYFAVDSSDEEAREEVGEPDSLIIERLPMKSMTYLHEIDDTELLTENDDIEIDNSLKLRQSDSRKRKGDTILTHSGKKKPVYRKVLTITDLENMPQESNTMIDDSTENENDEVDANPKQWKDRCDKENNFYNSPYDIKAKLRGIRKLKPKVKCSLGNEEVGRINDAGNISGWSDEDNNAPLNVFDDEEVDLEKVIPVLRIASKTCKQKNKNPETPVATRKSKRTLKKKLPANGFVSYADYDSPLEEVQMNEQVDCKARSTIMLHGKQKLDIKDQLKSVAKLPTEAKVQRRSGRFKSASQKVRSLEMGKEEVRTQANPSRVLVHCAGVNECPDNNIAPCQKVSQIDETMLAHDGKINLEKVIPVLRIASKRGKQKNKNPETPVATRKSKRTVKKKLPANGFVSYADYDSPSEEVQMNEQVDCKARSTIMLHGKQKLDIKDQLKSVVRLPTEAKVQRRSGRFKSASQKERSLEMGKEEVRTQANPSRVLVHCAGVNECPDFNIAPCQKVSQLDETMLAHDGKIENDDLEGYSDDMTPQSEDLAQQSEDLAQQSEDLAPQSEDLAPLSEDLAPQSEDLAPQSEDLTQQRNLEMTLAHSELEIDDKEKETIAYDTSEASQFK